MFEDLARAISDVVSGTLERLNVRTIYGDPISAEGVTVIPVAKVSFGFGGGGGGGSGQDPSGKGDGIDSISGGSGGGGGGGGGGAVQPIGYIEVTANGSRWIAIERAPMEQMLRFLTAILASLPIGGRKGLLNRLAFFVTAQALLSFAFRPRMPSLGALPFSQHRR